MASKKWECKVVLPWVTLMGEATVFWCWWCDVCVVVGVVAEQQSRQGSVGTPRDRWREGRTGGGCAATCQAWELLCVYHRETVPTQNNEHALPLLNKKGISAFFSPLKVMELEIGSPHKASSLSAVPSGPVQCQGWGHYQQCSPKLSIFL